MTDWLQTGSRASGQDWINGLYAQQDRQRAGRQLAAGDPRAASNTLYAGGDLQGGRVLANDARETANAERAAQSQATLRIARALREAKEQGRDVIATYDAFRPQIMQTGVDEQQFAQLRELLASDPNALDTVERLAGAEADRYDIREVNGDLIRTNERSGRVETLIDNPDRPIVTPYGILLPPSAGGAAGSPGQPAPVTGAAISAAPLSGLPPAPLGDDVSFETVIPALMQREGGFVASDGRSGAPANFGINQAANPDIDVRNLTPERAQEVYRERYWEPVVQAGVPGPAREAVFDFAVNAGPRRALQFWEQAGGDMARFNELRLAHYRRQPDYEQFGRSWERRVEETSGGTAQGDAFDQEGSTQGGLRPVGGGWNLQQMETPAEARALRAESRAERREERLDRRAETQDERAAREAASSASARVFTQENQLRGQLGQHPAIKALATVRPQIGIIGDIAARVARGEEISAQDDLALIFSFMKVLDPGSVVREGEFANAQNTGGIPDRVVNAYNNALRGTRLNDEQRTEFFGTASRVMRQYDEAAQAAINRTRQTTESYGLNPDRVAPLPPPRAETGGAPRLRFQPTEAQTRLSQQIVRSRPSEGHRGERTNPILINPADPNASFANVPRGGYFITPDGQLRGPKP